MSDQKKIGNLTDLELKAVIGDPRFTEYYRGATKAIAPPEESQITRMAEIRAAHTPEELQRSFSWVIRVFDPMIREREGKPHVYFAEILSTARTRKKGLTKFPHNFTQDNSLAAEWMALHYIHIILDASLKTDQEKIQAMIATELAEYQQSGEVLYNQTWELISTPELRLRTRYIK